MSKSKHTKTQARPPAHSDSSGGHDAVHTLEARLVGLLSDVRAAQWVLRAAVQRETEATDAAELLRASLRDATRQLRELPATIRERDAAVEACGQLRSDLQAACDDRDAARRIKKIMKLNKFSRLKMAQYGTHVLTYR